MAFVQDVAPGPGDSATPLCDDVDMQAHSSAVDFAHIARLLSSIARAHGHVAPSFRSPPRLVGVDRSVRRFAGGAVSVAVAVRGRPWAAVVADMIEGVVVANRLTPPLADRLRTEMWAAVTDGHGLVADVA